MRENSKKDRPTSRESTRASRFLIHRQLGALCDTIAEEKRRDEQHHQHESDQSRKGGQDFRRAFHQSPELSTGGIEQTASTPAGVDDDQHCRATSDKCRRTARAFSSSRASAASFR